jgi:RNA polymerase sigma factor (sigma-70 family)
MTGPDADELVTSLFQEWYAFAVRFTAPRTGSIESAEDLVQNALLQLFGELLRGTVIHNPKAWTFCVVRREAIRSAIKQRNEAGRQMPVDFLETVPAGWASPPELDRDPERLRSFLACLTRREEDVVSLRLTGMNYREIAETLDISVGAVAKLLNRALAKTDLKPAVVEPERKPANLPIRDGEKDRKRPLQ